MTETTCRLAPLGMRVVVKLTDKEDRTPGGIYLPDQAQKKPTQGRIVAVGPGRVMEGGERITPTVSVGETVILSKYAGNEVTVDGEEFTIIDEDQIFAVLNPV